MTDDADLDVKVVLEQAKAPASPPAPKDPGEQYRASIDRYREAAKWAVGAFGSIGALIVAALPLANLGAGVSADRGQTILGAVLALGGVTLAIASMLSVLAPRSVFSFELRAKKRNGLMRLLSGDAAMEHMLHTHGRALLPNGITDVPGLTEGIDNLDEVIAAAEQAGPGDSPAVKSLKARQALMVETLQRLTWIARVEKMRAAFHVSSVLILVAGLFVGAGLGLLLDALYDGSTSRKARSETVKVQAETAKLIAEGRKLVAETPAGGGADQAGELDAARPTPAVDVLLTDDGLALLPGCPLEADTPLAGVLLSGDAATGWEVVVLPTDTCAGGQLVLTPELGTVR